MGDETSTETTDEFGHRVTIGPDGSRTVELGGVTIEGDPEAGRAYVDGERMALTGDLNPDHVKQRDVDHPDSFAEGYVDEQARLEELARRPVEIPTGRPEIGPDPGTGVPVPDNWNPYEEEYERLFGETNKPDEEGENHTPTVPPPPGPFEGAGLE